MIEIVPLFKALADESRIKILSLISTQGLSVEEIAGVVGLTPATVSHHLARLRDAGLVEATPQGYYTIYHFRQEPLFDALRRLAEHQPPPDAHQDLARYDRKVLGDYLVEGKLKAIPAQRKKREVILRFLAEQFEIGRIYGEKEVNQIVGLYHDDFATLRRELVMSGLLQRDHGEYRRTALPSDERTDAAQRSSLA